MNWIKKSVTLILLLFSTLGIATGYAALTDNFFIYGEASLTGKPFEGVYISNAEFYSTSGVSDISIDYFKPTNLSQTVRATRSGGSITYKVTFHNNSSVTYWYVRTEYEDFVESNSLIGASGGITVTTKDHPNDTYSTFNSDDWIPPNTYRDVYITYTFGANAQSYQATLVNYLFGIKIDAVHDQFLTVLNDKVGGGYNSLSEAFDKKYRETGECVIANIGEEKALFDSLFGHELTIDIDGEEVPVTVMVRRENVDNRTTGDSYGVNGGPTGCEYTVYITVDELNSPTGKAIVYAVSYSNRGTAGNGDTWYQLGQLYEGEANRIDYDTETAGNQGAFDVYSWIATPNRYEVANGRSYLVGQEQGDQYDKLKTLEQIMATNDQDIFNDIDNSRILKTAYDMVAKSDNVNKPGYIALREAFYAAAPFYNIFNNGQEVKVKRTGTRAEIIPYIEAIQEAMDYFNEVN